MMKRILLLSGAMLIIIFLFVACTAGGDAKGQVIEAYIKAVISQDANRVSSLSCKNWESNAIMEMDSYQTVTATTEGLSCKSASGSGDTVQVSCTGKIIATYNDEKTTFDLSKRTYQVSKEGGEWRVCSVK